MATTWRGLTSSRVTAALGSSARFVTSWPVSSSPPLLSTTLPSASAMACEPPSAKGQPGGVRGERQRQAEGAGERRGEGLDGVGRQPGQQRPGARGVEPAGQEGDGESAGHPEAGQDERVRRHAQHRAEEVGQQVVPAIEQRRHQPPVGVGVAVEPVGGLVERAVEEDGVAVGQGMGQGHGRMGPPQPVILQAEGLEGR